MEVESGKKDDRAELNRALRECKLTGATLLIAKLDRLSRDAHFLFGLEKAGIDFTACDMPTANRMTVGLMAVVAEEEGKAISARTKAALAQSTKKLGGWRGGPVGDPTAARKALSAKAAAYAASVAPIASELRIQGFSLRQIAERMVARGVKTARGGEWTATAVRRPARGRLTGHSLRQFLLNHIHHKPLPPRPARSELGERRRREANGHQLLRIAQRRPAASNDALAFPHLCPVKELGRQFWRVIRVNPFALPRFCVLVHGHTSSKLSAAHSLVQSKRAPQTGRAGSRR